MKVARSGYYAYRKRKTAADITTGEAAQATEVRECFYEHRRRYGSRRIAKQLKLGRFRVRRLMKQENLRAIQPKSFVPRTTDSRHGGRIRYEFVEEPDR